MVGRREKQKKLTKENWKEGISGRRPTASGPAGRPAGSISMPFALSISLLYISPSLWLSLFVFSITHSIFTSHSLSLSPLLRSSPFSLSYCVLFLSIDCLGRMEKHKMNLTTFASSHAHTGACVTLCDEPLLLYVLFL